MRSIFLKRLAIIVVMACVAMSAHAAENAKSNGYDEAFEQLKALVGEWDIKDSPSRVTSHLTGNGTTLVEEFRGRRGMASVYHMDNGNLMLTHYCSAGNQPRMRAVAYDPAEGSVKFDFIDVTNLSGPSAYHTRELEILFQDKDHIQLRFIGQEEGEEIAVAHSLVRQK